MTINFYLQTSPSSSTIYLYVREGSSEKNYTVKISTKIIINTGDWNKDAQNHHYDEKLNIRLANMRRRAEEIFHIVKGSGRFNGTVILKYLKKYLFNSDDIRIINIKGQGKGAMRGCKENIIYILNEPETDNYKIGCCVNFKLRVQQLNSGRSKSLIHVAAYHIPSGLFHTARNIENYFMHDRLKNRRIKKHDRDYKSEWFELLNFDLQDVDKIIIEFFRGIPIIEEYKIHEHMRNKVWEILKKAEAA